jgi:hypothetical protein
LQLHSGQLANRTCQPRGPSERYQSVKHTEYSTEKHFENSSLLACGSGGFSRTWTRDLLCGVRAVQAVHLQAINQLKEGMQIQGNNPRAKCTACIFGMKLPGDHQGTTLSELDCVLGLCNSPSPKKGVTQLLLQHGIYCSVQLVLAEYHPFMRYEPHLQ